MTQVLPRKPSGPERMLRLATRLVLAALLAGFNMASTQPSGCDPIDANDDGECDLFQDADLTRSCREVNTVFVSAPNPLCLYNFRYDKITRYTLPECGIEEFEANTVIQFRGGEYRGQPGISDVRNREVKFVSARLIADPMQPCPGGQGGRP